MQLNGFFLKDVDCITLGGFVQIAIYISSCMNCDFIYPAAEVQCSSAGITANQMCSSFTCVVASWVGERGLFGSKVHMLLEDICALKRIPADFLMVSNPSRPALNSQLLYLSVVYVVRFRGATFWNALQL